MLNDAHVNAAANDTFDKSGIAKNAREEKIRARDAKMKQDAENCQDGQAVPQGSARARRPRGGFVAIGAIGGLGGINPAPAAPAASNVEVVNQIEETVSGD